MKVAIFTQAGSLFSVQLLLARKMDISPGTSRNSAHADGGCLLRRLIRFCLNTGDQGLSGSRPADSRCFQYWVFFVLSNKWVNKIQCSDDRKEATPSIK